VSDEDLRRIEVELQVSHLDVDEFADSGPGGEQRLDHQAVLGRLAVGGVDQAANLVLIKAVDGAAALFGGLSCNSRRTCSTTCLVWS